MIRVKPKWNLNNILDLTLYPQITLLEDLIIIIRLASQIRNRNFIRWIPYFAKGSKVKKGKKRFLLILKNNSLFLHFRADIMRCLSSVAFENKLLGGPDLDKDCKKEFKKQYIQQEKVILYF